jgi:cyclopropane fatty-acyl-phospholipid synthase-like methyltransferase
VTVDLLVVLAVQAAVVTVAMALTAYAARRAGEHYVWTVDAWMENFTEHRAALQALVGEEAMRVWELYLVGGRMAFRDGRMGVDQILAVRPGDAHDLAPVRSW